jgi:hypothetical protein
MAMDASGATLSLTRPGESAPVGQWASGCSFIFFNVTVGICWACLFGFGAYAVGAEICKISGTLSLISLGLFIAMGYAPSNFI